MNLNKMKDNTIKVTKIKCDCKKHSIETNYGFRICTKRGNEFDD